jgi:hypothetical protein
MCNLILRKQPAKPTVFIGANATTDLLHAVAYFISWGESKGFAMK